MGWYSYTTAHPNLLAKGRSYKKGCQTNSCGCRKRWNQCSPACKCHNSCTNTEAQASTCNTTLASTNFSSEDEDDESIYEDDEDKYITDDDDYIYSDLEFEVITDTDIFSSMDII